MFEYVDRCIEMPKESYGKVHFEANKTYTRTEGLSALNFTQRKLSQRAGVNEDQPFQGGEQRHIAKALSPSSATPSLFLSIYWSKQPSIYIIIYSICLSVYM